MELKATQKCKKNTCISLINSRITVKLCIIGAHEKPTPHTHENSEISTDVIDNAVIMLNFKRLYLSSLWMKISKNWLGYLLTNSC